jgi:hypothetical protein
MSFLGFIIILPFAALAGWSIFAIFRWLRRGAYEQKWWRAFAMLALVGLGLGILFTFFVQYNVANMHIEGFPIPIGIANRQKPDEPWVKSDMPASIRIGGMVTDLLSGIALSLAPIAVAAFFKENRAKNPQFFPRPTNPP